MNSFYNRFRNEREKIKNQSKAERLEQNIIRIEKILAHRDFPAWPFIQSLIKEKIIRVEKQLDNYESFGETGLKLLHKEKENMVYFHDLFDQLEFELKEYKLEYERTKAKIQTEPVTVGG